MTTPKTPPTLADLADRMEAAWRSWDFICDDMGSHEDARDARAKLISVAVEYVEARRAARDAGMVDCMLAKETVAALRRAFEVPVYDDMTGRWVEAVRLLWLDKGVEPLLKDPKE